MNKSNAGDSSTKLSISQLVNRHFDLLSHIPSEIDSFTSIRETLLLSLPQGAQVYWAPVRAAVHESSRDAAPAGFNQRESGSSIVGT